MTSPSPATSQSSTPRPGSDAPDLGPDAPAPAAGPAPADGAQCLRVAVIGAGPVGLALALQAARRLPKAQVTVYDAAPAQRDVSGDPRTLALSLGSVQELQRLGVWAQIEGQAASIRQVHVSQQQPAWPGLPAPELLIRAADLGQPRLGAVASYGAIVAPLRAAWLAACAREPQRLQARLGVTVRHVHAPRHAPVARLVLGEGQGKHQGEGEAKVDGEGAAEADALHDLVVTAEGGVFADQAPKAVSRDYAQTAWVGTVEIEGGEPGVAYERFTSAGPVALLPLPARPDSPAGRQRAALVWCVASHDDPVRTLDAEQRRVVLQNVFAPRVGRLVAVSPLKPFALGLNAERSLVHGRSIHIGNAAQTLHPVAGQGLNLGLRDAAELVDCLARLREPRDLIKALRELDLQRMPDRWSLIGATDFLARSFTWSAPGLTTLRGTGLGLLQLATPLKHAVARHMMFGWR